MSSAKSTPRKSQMAGRTSVNPWIKLSRKPPFVPTGEYGQIERFNDRVEPEHRLICDLLPIPYLGRPDAPIVLLNLNPGSHPDDHLLQTTKKFVRACRNCLAHERTEFPFFYLDPHLEGPNGGPAYRWWARVFRPLLKEYEYDEAFLAKAFFCVEYLPYRSREFRPIERLASQEYGFELVKKAMKRQALVVLMRSKALWFRAVPELQHYKKLLTLTNRRNPVLSEKNCPDGFTHIIRALKKLR